MSEAACGQGTLTAGNGPVGRGTNLSLPRAIAESATKAVIMIASSRIIGQSQTNSRSPGYGESGDSLKNHEGASWDDEFNRGF